ncbi:hypothetical protein J6590_014939 [Homalodisca vitripennis]|nr:hypothetical protein J6590_014939 [Homalodisca vitripennis]
MNPYPFPSLKNQKNIKKLQFNIDGKSSRAKRSRRDIPSKCPQCDKVYSQRGSMLRHLRLECGVLPQFQCPVCTYSSYRKGNINRHMAIHTASLEPKPGEFKF